jgi:hypothetical protein
MGKEYGKKEGTNIKARNYKEKKEMGYGMKTQK